MKKLTSTLKGILHHGERGESCKVTSKMRNILDLVAKCTKRCTVFHQGGQGSRVKESRFTSEELGSTWKVVVDVKAAE